MGIRLAKSDDNHGANNAEQVRIAKEYLATLRAQEASQQASQQAAQRGGRR